jgi:hypothetical protein
MCGNKEKLRNMLSPCRLELANCRRTIRTEVRHLICEKPVAQTTRRTLQGLPRTSP